MLTLTQKSFEYSILFAAECETGTVILVSTCAMVRPVASDENKQIGLLFAVAVTSPAVRKKGSSSDKPVLLLTTLRTKELGC